MKRCRMVFSGSGGQGVITATIILAEAAVTYENLVAVQTQVYGAAARGGATRSDVVISDSPINYPKVIQPNVLVCLTQEAYNKFYPILRPGGLLIVDSKYVKTQRNLAAVQYELDMHKVVMTAIGNPIVFNICMLGSIISLTDIVKRDSVLKVLKNRIHADFLSMNEEALDIGIELGKEQSPYYDF